MNGNKARWTVIDSGSLSGERNMAIDAESLAKAQKGNLPPSLRLFQWNERTVSYGHLLNPLEAAGWAKERGVISVIKRPTGGGVVLHEPYDLSCSLVWIRRAGIFSENPRECYEAIHSLLKEGLSHFFGQPVDRYIKPKGNCESRHSRGGGNLDSDWIPASAGMTELPVCFQQPVCNDVMMNGEKVIGGALRITRNAILYQGNVQLKFMVDAELLKQALLKPFFAEPALAL